MSYVNNNGVKIHYEVEGQGPPLLLMHGFGDSIEAWHQYGYIDALKNDYRIILVDARGHGLSDKPQDEESYQFVHMVGDLVAVLDALDMADAHYFGYSMGANAGFYIPVYAPERFRSLILGGWAFARTGLEAIDYRAMFAVHKSIKQAIAENPANPMAAFVANIENRTGPLSAALKEHYLSLDALALAAIAGAHGNPAGPKVEEILPLIKTPCLIYAGENDPILDAARECARRIPGAIFVSFPGLNHLQRFEHSEVVMPHIKKFLAGANKGG
jgi:pimeloyl-ACP methyl ester carboxylesterase